MADDAVVSVYVAAPLCEEAKDAVSAKGGRAGELRVRIVCLKRVEFGESIDLAEIGANARRATEDSASVAYVEQAGPVVEFSRPIVEAAGIAYLAARSGKKASQQILAAIEESDSSSLRSSLNESLGSGS